MDMNYKNPIRLFEPSPVVRDGGNPGNTSLQAAKPATGTHDKEAPRPLEGSGMGLSVNKKTVRKALKFVF